MIILLARGRKGFVSCFDEAVKFGHQTGLLRRPRRQRVRGGGGFPRQTRLSVVHGMADSEDDDRCLVSVVFAQFREREASPEGGRNR